MAKTTFTTTTRLDPDAGLKVHCEARGKTFILDEPPSLGGTDEGMNPVEALLGALGGCKCIVARSFAAAHGIKLKSIRVVLDGVLDPEGFLGANPEAKVGFSKITEKFYVEADNPEEEINAYLDFMDEHCPVMDSIVNAPEFERELHLNVDSSASSSVRRQVSR